MLGNGLDEVGQQNIAIRETSNIICGQCDLNLVVDAEPVMHQIVETESELTTRDGGPSCLP